MSALDPRKYEIVMIGITKTGRWLTGDVTRALEEGLENVAMPAILLTDPHSSALMEIQRGETALTGLSKVTEIDVIFPVLHGPYGEDGTVQGLLELAGIPYVGAGVVGSAVGMDKAIFKAVMHSHGLPLLPWSLVLASEWKKHPHRLIKNLEDKHTYPMFTKPANLGSSVGICKCLDRQELADGLSEAARFDRRLVVEQGIDARELEVSVLGNDDPIASVVGEIRPRRDFYDYIAKYVTEQGSEDESELIIPAKLELRISDHIRSTAIRVFKAIDCAGLGRVDFLLDRSDEQLYVNELNTIPGFTRISMYPKLWQATGISYPELLERLIELALERHDVKSRLTTTFEVDADG
jgi:D-alanine-D-alanine ligase